MVLSVSLIVVLAFLILLATAPKNMHLFELLFNGMTLNFFHVSQFSMFNNLKLISVSGHLDKLISFVCIRYVVFTAFVLFYLQLYLALRSGLAKSALTLACVALLVLAQYALQWAGILYFSSQTGLWSTAAWLAIVLLTLAGMKLFRHLARKEVKLP
ncbi:hypothetical protein [Paenibacillus arenilitoris]|uniref:Uncharacterized protein n=1 Tax=Paenibacillus arenilitoris TaxID=2772299 RepID=A0A927CLB3_9BACL|nr:hypothetical protein [Paenibacillus arenilitoris]MBD2868688.1 hypothetical protein [Paenibacillus arenilitoris]